MMKKFYDEYMNQVRFFYTQSQINGFARRINNWIKQNQLQDTDHLYIDVIGIRIGRTFQH
jgi:hypothetical protein